MLLRLPLFLSLFLISSIAWSGPQTLNLSKEWIRHSLTTQYIYGSWKNFAPPFGTDQVNDGLTDLFDSNGESQLCFPAALTTALVKQMAFQEKPLQTMKLPGLSSEKNEIDLNEVVRDLTTRCQTSTESGTYMNHGANCLSELYKELRIKSEIKVIRTFKSNIETVEDVTSEIRKIEISDITAAIDDGYDVIALVDWNKPNTEATKWEREGGHFVNIFGYARQIPWRDMIMLFISNPYRWYDNKSPYQAYDSVFAQVVPDDRPLTMSPAASDITLEGPGFVGRTNRGFISGILKFKAEESL